MTYMNHDEPYSDDYLQDILASVKTIAMVGASPDKTKFSYGVLRVLHETGYDMIPVNPRPGLAEIRGLKVYPTLASIDRPVDMVEVFRRPGFVWHRARGHCHWRESAVGTDWRCRSTGGAACRTGRVARGDGSLSKD